MSIISLIKNKKDIGVRVIKKTGLFRGTLICGIFFIYNLHKKHLIKKIRSKNKKKTAKVQLFNKKNFIVSMNDSGLSFDIYLSKIREPYVTKKIIDLLKNERLNTFLDLGTNIGYYSIVLGDFFNKIICVEPNKKAIEILQKNISLNKYDKKTTILEGGVHFDDKQDLFMIEKPDFNLSEVSTTKGDYKIETFQFHKIFQKYKPDFIKMDIEGFEYALFLEQEDQILKLKEDMPKYIFIELHHEKTTQSNNIKLFRLLDKLGYRVNSAIWEEKGPNYLQDRSFIWKVLNSILRRLFTKDPFLAKDMDIMDFVNKRKDVIKGKMGAIEYIFEKK